MDAPAIGRVAALDAGLEVTVPGIQVDRRCGSGLQAVLYAAMAVQTGGASLVLAGGAESMSGATYYSQAPRWGTKAGGFQMKDALAEGRVHAGGKDHPVWGGMIETAENVRKRYSIGREEQDRLAVRSHEKATAAVKDGPLRRRAGAGDGARAQVGHGRRGRRAHPPGRGAGEALDAAPDHGQAGPGRDGDRRATPRGRTTAPRCAS